MMPIFLSIASYRDSHLKHTLRSAVDRADQPDKIHFGIVHQGLDKERPDMSMLPHYSLISVGIGDASGVGHARSLAMSLYNDEAYYMQIDSHTQFVEGWDTRCIRQLEEAKKQTGGRAILSYYPVPYYMDGTHVWLQTKSNSDFKSYPMKQKVKLRQGKHWTSERVEFADPSRSVPELSNTILGGFVFTDGDIVKEVPYDPEISFFGEEICFSARAWTRGWDIFSPTENLVYHYYGRNGEKKIWKDVSSRKIQWSEIEEISTQKQKKVLCGIEQGVYGLGNTRRIEQYEELVGFNFKEFYEIGK